MMELHQLEEIPLNHNWNSSLQLEVEGVVVIVGNVTECDSLETSSAVVPNGIEIRTGDFIFVAVIIDQNLLILGLGWSVPEAMQWSTKQQSETAIAENGNFLDILRSHVTWFYPLSKSQNKNKTSLRYSGRVVKAMPC